MDRGTLEGFHEVNLSSPGTPFDPCSGRDPLCGAGYSSSSAEPLPRVSLSDRILKTAIYDPFDRIQARDLTTERGPEFAQLPSSVSHGLTNGCSSSRCILTSSSPDNLSPVLPSQPPSPPSTTSSVDSAADVCGCTVGSSRASISMWKCKSVVDRKDEVCDGAYLLEGEKCEEEDEERAQKGDGHCKCVVNGDADHAFIKGCHAASRLHSPSVMEIKEKGYERLKEELTKAQQELKLKDEECERLSKVRDQLGQELEDLTASLFEEAHKMVRDANLKRVTAEKQLAEAQGKIDVLQAEVIALKALVLTSTPSSPNRVLHPQLQAQAKGAMFRRGHTRNKSTSSAMPVPAVPSPEPAKTTDASTRSNKELGAFPAAAQQTNDVDILLFIEFKVWKDSPTFDKNCFFLKRIYCEDVEPCLSFPKSELARAVLKAVEDNTLSIEPVGTQSLPVVKASAIECGGPKKCALTGQSRACKHRIKLGESSSSYYISPSCRGRITAVCNFFTYIRYIQNGLVKQDVEQMFCEVVKLRYEMSRAKLGFWKDP
uniref:guanine nucleotide exchange factor for Rab-3A-like n=1 Tax=Myxine glutinosa TaxID=7769 RepID=UPI00358FEF9B